MKKENKKAKAADFDKAFDSGETIVPYLDLKSAKVHMPIQRINIDIPAEILAKVDKEAGRVGIPRTSLIKVWIAERVDQLVG